MKTYLRELKINEVRGIMYCDGGASEVILMPNIISGQFDLVERYLIPMEEWSDDMINQLIDHNIRVKESKVI